MDIGFATIDNGVYDDLLGKCGLDVTVYKAIHSPAWIYNDHIRHCGNKYICFIHSDTRVQGLLEAIERTIHAHPDFGALGAVGSNNGTIWGRHGAIWEVVTVDSCCIVINAEHGLMFDKKTFHEYHLYVEDYCMQTRELGLHNYTLDLNAYENRDRLVVKEPYFVHHSHTLHQLGCSWGLYPKFRKLLSEKWPNVETT